MKLNGHADRFGLYFSQDRTISWARRIAPKTTIVCLCAFVCVISMAWVQSACAGWGDTGLSSGKQETYNKMVLFTVPWGNPPKGIPLYRPEEHGLPKPQQPYYPSSYRLLVDSEMNVWIGHGGRITKYSPSGKLLFHNDKLRDGGVDLILSEAPIHRDAHGGFVFGGKRGDKANRVRIDGEGKMTENPDPSPQAISYAVYPMPIDPWGDDGHIGIFREGSSTPYAVYPVKTNGGLLMLSGRIQMDDAGNAYVLHRLKRTADVRGGGRIYVYQIVSPEGKLFGQVYTEETFQQPEPEDRVFTVDRKGNVYQLLPTKKGARVICWKLRQR